MSREGQGTGWSPAAANRAAQRSQAGRLGPLARKPIRGRSCPPRPAAPPASINCFTRSLARRYTGPAMFTRRSFLQTAASASAALTLTAPLHRLLAQANSVYRNPILGGDHPDASPIRVGNEFFLTHSSFDYAPGLLIWRSADLVNWRPVAAALHRDRKSTRLN